MKRPLVREKITIVLIGTLDTKMPEYAFVLRLLREAGSDVRLVDVSLRGEGSPEAAVRPAAVAARGGLGLGALHRLDRHDAARVMVEGASRILEEWVEKSEVHGVLALGGANGTHLACGVMRTLPLGFPKVMVSTMASGQVRQYVGASDIVMIPSIGDLSLNRVSRQILAEAVGAVLGMAALPLDRDSRPVPLLALTSFGVTQPCVDRVKSGLEAEGYEVMLFHASGSGGGALEELVGKGVIDGVIDLTTSELTDALVGGSFSAGPDRLGGAGERGIPQVVVPGALDLVNFWVQDFPSEKFAGRLLHHYNPDILLMRASVEECRELGRIVARKLNAARGPVAVLIPLRGFSLLDREGGPEVSPYKGSPEGPWYDPEADRAFVDGLMAAIKDVEVRQVDAHINDPSFADLLVQRACELFERPGLRRRDS
ncbi:MAG: Tm-1-like ATP-binding domain-containing protein [Nitrospinota bacterium]